MSFDTTPDPHFLYGMKHQSWTLTGALAEFVDNSFGPGRGNADTCEITYNPTNRTLGIVDDGVGMTSIGRLFQLGNTIGRSPGDIGLYGSGGTMALLWLASTAAVYTLVDGKVSSDTVTWKEWIDKRQFPQINDTWKPANYSTCPTDLLAKGHGTAIVIKLDSSRNKPNPSHVKRDLAKIYGPGIRAGKRIIWTTLGKSGGTETLTDTSYAAADDDKTVSLDFIVTYGDDDLPVSGSVSLVEGLPMTESGISIGYGVRVITKTKDCFVSPDGMRRFSGSGVAGYLDLGDGWQPYLSTTKDRINDGPLWDALMSFVFEKIEPLLEESDDEKLTLELEDIALSLQDALAGTATVTVPKKVAEVLAPEGTGMGEPLQPVDDTPKDDDVTDESDVSTEKPAKPTILIYKESEETIGAVLCRSDLIKNFISVSVNKDHDLIQLALKSKPTNRMLLNQIVVNEIAVQLATNQEMCALVFKPKVYASIADAVDDREKQRLIVKLLTDNIKSKAA